MDFLGIFAFAYNSAQSLYFYSIKEVGSFAFAYSHHLGAILIGNDDCVLGKGLFRYCNELKPSHILIDNANANGSNDTFQGYPYLSNVNLTSENIVKGAFMDCYGLTSVTIADTVKVIEENAFLRCYNLEEIIIPESVEKIESGAFSECYNLKSFTVLGNPEISEFKIFNNPYTLEVITKVYCQANTYILQYCIDNNIDYEIID